MRVSDGRDVGSRRGTRTAFRPFSYFADTGWEGRSAVTLLFGEQRTSTAVHEIKDLSFRLDAMVKTIMKKTKSGSKVRKDEDSPSQLIDARNKELSDWRVETLARIRMLIQQADPEVVEEVKWRKPSNAM